MVLGILTLHNSHWTILLMQAKMAGRLTWCTFIFHLIVSYRSHILTSTNYWNFIKLPKFWFTNIDFTHLLPIYDYFFTFSLDFTTFSTCVPKNTKTIFWQTCRWVWKQETMLYKNASTLKSFENVYVQFSELFASAPHQGTLRWIRAQFPDATVSEFRPKFHNTEQRRSWRWKNPIIKSNEFEGF